MLENKKNVLFDMDGLLIDSEALGIKMWEKVFAQHNEPFNPEAAYRSIGSKWPGITRNIRKTYRE